MLATRSLEATQYSRHVLGLRPIPRRWAHYLIALLLLFLHPLHVPSTRYCLYKATFRGSDASESCCLGSLPSIWASTLSSSVDNIYIEIDLKSTQEH